MNVKLFFNQSPDNYLSKTIAQKGDYGCNIKENCSILNPTIIIRDDNVIKSQCNYMYIQELHRYYYITDIVMTSFKIVEVTGRVDVLMSYKEQILASQGIVTRNENLFNGYLNDMYMKQLSYQRVQTKQLGRFFQTSPNYVLIASGNMKIKS